MQNRNQYGFPAPSALDRVDQMTPLTCDQPGEYLPVADPAEDQEEAENWRDELAPGERAVFDLVMERTVHTILPDIGAGNIAWVVEETLWQLRRYAMQAQTLHLPGAGQWERQR